MMTPKLLVELRFVVSVLVMAWMFLGIAKAQGPPEASEEREGYLIRIPLPITGEADLQIQSAIEKVLERLPAAERAQDRPVLVLQFDTSNGASGRGSQLERCLSLARFLTSGTLNRVQTIAYMTGESRGDSEPVPLSGHALLVALACEQWYMAEEAAIGGVAEEDIADSLVAEAYRSVANRRLVMPEALVLGLLEPRRGIFRLELVDGSLQWGDQATVLELEQAGKVAVAETLAEPGEEARFSSDLLLRYQLIEQRIRDRRDLASLLRLRPEALEGDPSLGKDWNSVAIRLEGPVDQEMVSWILASLQQQLDQGANLVMVEINSLGGSFRDANRLAQRLAQLDPLEVRTVAFVRGEARGSAALVALACQHIVLEQTAELGGQGQPVLSEDEQKSLEEVTPELAAWVGRDEAVILALVNPTKTLIQYHHGVTGEIRFFTEEEVRLGQLSPDWQRGREIAVTEGLDASSVDDLRIARFIVKDAGELHSLYQLSEPPKLLVPTVAYRGIQRFARFLASPWISWMLLFGAMMFFSTEMSSPGLGFPGFAAGLCFMLYFWSHYLNGNADWLEIMLFVLGAVSLALEIFVVPGFGIFGVGGILMMLVSVVLAAQTFVWPTSREDFSQLPVSLSMVLALFLGVAIPMMLIPKYMHRLPILNRFSLNPSEDEEFAEVSEREAISHLEYLTGKMGVAVTSLVPGGKVKFGDDVFSVVTDGRPVESGESVVVREVRGNHVLVDPVEV
jgi:membrane-bound serine protease (ClpP class)